MRPSDSKLRRRIAWEAARLLRHRRETQFQDARLSAARRFSSQPLRRAELPTNREIREALRMMAMRAPDHPLADQLRALRLAALDLMKRLRPLRPRLVGRVLTGQIGPASPIEIHVFGNSPRRLCETMAQQGLQPEPAASEICGPSPAGRSEPSPSRRSPRQALAVVQLQLPAAVACLRLYPTRYARRAWRGKKTGRRMPRAGISQLEQLLDWEHPEATPPGQTRYPPGLSDRFAVYRALLLPLEHIRLPPERHPEGDALYHSLQVFDLARDELPYDEEFLLAALLHDVGKAIDPRDPLAAGLKALDGHVTPRTRWLIENQPAAQAIREGKIGTRAYRRLQRSEDLDELMLLLQCDRRGRQAGVQVCDVDEALDYLRELSGMCGD